MDNETRAKEWADSLDFQEVAAIGAAKRCGVQWTPWMGDWFTSWSPRNGNNNAEGTWEHWVNLALGILDDPLTKVVAPKVHAAAREHLPPLNPDTYSDTERALTYAELMQRFRKEED